MGLPGITREQMITVDHIMTKGLNIPVELMMEQAGLNLARFSLNILQQKDLKSVIIISGAGNNGGGGLVAARRLWSWGIDVKIFLPKGEEKLRDVPRNQYIRCKKLGITIINDITTIDHELPMDNYLFLDCYIGYNFRERKDNSSSKVFDFYNDINNVISLDVPSGLDLSIGTTENFSPLATLTIAFVKQKLLEVTPKRTGELFVIDIGIPIIIFRQMIGIDWSVNNINDLKLLYSAFQKIPIVKVSTTQDMPSENKKWIVNYH